MSPVQRPDPKSEAPVDAADAVRQSLPTASAPAPASAASAPRTPLVEGAVTVELVALAQLWADQFRHLATLSVAGFGGVLILTQSQLLEVQTKLWVALGLCAASALLAMQGQIGVVDGATQGKAPGRRAKVIRGLAAICLGGAGGTVVGILIGR